MIYSSWDGDLDSLKLVLLGHFLPFYPPKNQKIKIFKKWKSFKDTILQLQSYDVWFLRCRVKQTEFFVVVDHFLPFYPPNNLKIKILKKQKILSGDIIILYMHHKWESYIWFLRYGAQQTKFFVILDHFLPFSSTNNPKNKKLEKIEKKNREGIIILHKCTKNHDHKLHCSCDWWMTDVILIFH